MSLDPKTLQREALALVAVAALTNLGAKPAPALLRRASRARRRGLNRYSFSTRGPRKPAQAKKILEEATARVAPRRKHGPKKQEDDE